MAPAFAGKKNFTCHMQAVHLNYSQEIEPYIMFDLFKLLFWSENKVVYRSIARELQTNSLRVYRLAHGKRAKCDRDYKILQKLRKQEIIKGMAYSN